MLLQKNPSEVFLSLFKHTKIISWIPSHGEKMKEGYKTFETFYLLCSGKRVLICVGKGKKYAGKLQVRFASSA